MQEPRVAPTAYRHQVDEEDTLHAYRNALHYAIGTDDMDIAVGPAQDGTLLEVGFIRADNGEIVILHSMPARKKFL